MASTTVSTPTPDLAEQGARQIIAGAAAKYGINPSTLWGVYGAETGYGTDVHTSSAGAVGPFQFEPSTAAGLGVNPYSLKSAASGAADYLSQYKGRGELGMLSAYNAGPGGALQPGYAATVEKDAQTFGPTSGVPKQPSAQVPTASGSSLETKQDAVRQAITSDLLKGGGSGLTTSQLLTAAAARPPASLTGATIPGPATPSAATNVPAPAPSAASGPSVPLKYLGPAPGSLMGAGSTYVGPDQGLDFTNAGRQVPVFSLGDAVVTQMVPSGSGWAGQGGLLVYRLTSGPDAGRYVYTAEDFAPSGDLKVGSSIKQGQTIGVATGANQAPGIETGFAMNAQGQAYGNDQEGKHGNAPDPQALAFAQLVQRMGPAGMHVHVNPQTKKVIPYTTGG